MNCILLRVAADVMRHQHVRGFMRILIYIFVLTGLMTLTCANAQVDKAYKARMEIHKLKAFVEDAEMNGNVNRIVMYGLSTTHTTRLAITPSMLESKYDYRYDISRNGTYIYLSSLKRAIKSTEPIESGSVGEVHYGLILYGKNGERAFSIYCFGQEGSCQINGIPFRGGKSIVLWVSSFFRDGVD